MPDTDINSAVASDLKSAFAPGTENFYSVPATSSENASGVGDTRWHDSRYAHYKGYYDIIPELKKAIGTKATWTVGKGFTADMATEMLLNAIRGGGKDTFNSILENLIKLYHIGGNGYAEIITEDKIPILEGGILINLKPLDPEMMVNIENEQGILIGFEQTSRIKDKAPIPFKLHEIFYLPKDRLGAENHGTGIIKVLENIILARNEAIADWRRVLHRNIDPLWIFHMDTDDTTEIAAFKLKQDTARGKGENMYIPKGVIVPELAAINGNAILNPLPWIEVLNQYFWQATGGTDIVIGATVSITDGAAKIRYLAFQQEIEEEQLFIEEQVLNQLNLVINLEFPASLENEALSEKKKEGSMAAAKPNDTTTEMEGTQ